MQRPRKAIEPPDALVSLTIRIHPEARRQLKSRCALEDMSMEEKCRAVIYRDLGLENLPVVVEAAAASA